MSEVRRIAKNLVSIGTAYIASQVLNIVIAILIARRLGIEEYGIYVFALAFPTLFLLISNFGLDTVLVIDIAKDKSLAGSYLTNTIIFKLLLSGVAFLLIFLSARLLGFPDKHFLVILFIGLASVISSIGTAFASTFKAFERMEYLALLTVTERGLTTALVVGLLLLGNDLIMVAFVLLFTSSIYVILGGIITKAKFVEYAKRFDFRLMKELTRKGLPFMLTAVSGVILFRANVILLAIMKDAWTTGIYGAGYSLALSLIMLPSLYQTVILPVMSRYSMSSMEELLILLEKSRKYFLILALPIVVGGTFLARPIVTTLFGVEFSQSSWVFTIMIWAVGITFFTVGNGPFLASIGLQRLNAVSVAIGAFTNLSLCLVLIPSFGYVGAAVAFLSATISIATLSIYFVRTRVASTSMKSLIAKPLFAAALMCVPFLLSQYVGFLLTAIVATILYFATLILIGTLSSDDTKILRSMLPGNKS